MYTVKQVEQLILDNQQAQEAVVFLMDTIRAEPLWQPGAELDSELRSQKTHLEQVFVTLQQTHEQLHSGNAQFQQHAEVMRLDESSAAVQDILRDMLGANWDLSDGTTTTRDWLLDALNDLRHRRGLGPVKLATRTVD